MQFKCYAHPVNEVIDSAAFVAFRSDNKYVMGVLPTGDERLILRQHDAGDCPLRTPRNDLTLKAIEKCVPGILRASRDVLVLGTAVIEVVGEASQRQVRTVAGDFRLARRQNMRPFELACAANAQRANGQPTDPVSHHAA